MMRSGLFKIVDRCVYTYIISNTSNRYLYKHLCNNGRLYQVHVAR